MTRPLLPLALAAAIAFPALAAAAESPTPPRIVVSGEGAATVAPDLAVLTLSVMREAKTARAALDANNDAMAAVIAAMKSAGIKDRDLQTAGIQINPRYNYTNKPDGGQEAELIAYQVTNTLSVRVRDVDKTGEILDKAVSLGVNQGGGIVFTNDNPAATVAEARKKAVADAMAKAKTLAEAAGVSIGRVIEITDQNIAPPPIPINAKAFDAAVGAAPVQAGENAYNVQVTVTFELK
ncbi:SIMPL domain-containing protein [Mesorhizobium sp. BR1-1-9]|uniref:SIMPL domain-containing protein n=1 Tax=unclassified Mesorhizobium TaxID=325217 RepID=UPI001CD1185F|nr:MULTISPECIES: SIMPL domain-containing protein [unclassified Mesorhizobium]MBZ9872952.1 SIMPL domain-containing protein [Mesorhizobium sp. BR1-1-9]MBZ9944103.1 SIMPL domain-containing protein [Mesorhizobium sp. BR1-1-13]